MEDTREIDTFDSTNNNQASVNKPRFFVRLARVISRLTRGLGVVVRLGFYLFGVFILVSLLSSFVSDSNTSGLQKEYISGIGPEEVVVITINAAIFDDSSDSGLGLTNSSYITPRLIQKYLDEARYNELTRAVILRINSPGGSVTASEEIYQMIVRFKNETHIPVIASL